MAQKNEIKKAANGLYFRNLGYRRTSKRYTQPKFYLGGDEASARIANLKLEQLWKAVTHRWLRANPPTPRTKAGSVDQRIVTQTHCPVTGQKLLSPGIPMVVTIGVGEVEVVQEGKPAWDEVSLAIAHAIRQGEAVARVPVPNDLFRDGVSHGFVGRWLDDLRSDVPFIHIELQDSDVHNEAESQIHEAGSRLIEQGRRMTQRGIGGETLHAALSEYVKFLESKHIGLDGRVSPTGTTQVRQVEFLKTTFTDCPLATLDTPTIHALENTLALRPIGKRGKHIAVRTARNFIKQFRHFLRWLNTAPGFAWKRPSDFEPTVVRIVETAKERAATARTSRVQTYSTDEIRILWEYASPLKRLFLLLGLNCGFDAKMISTLEPEDVHLRKEHPHQREVGAVTSSDDSWIFRLRNKTSVYGEWKLWPITVQAIDWWLRQRENIKVDDGVSALIVNLGGHAYDTPTKGNDRNSQIPNLWKSLTTLIRKDDEHKEFRLLSFGKLRKTGGNLIRTQADGEISGVFLCHGTPVKSDDLLDCYTNRPFAKVFEAIDCVGQQLAPIWASVENPFPEVRKKGGGNISAGKINRIRKLRQQGYKVAHIAEKIGVSQQTVIRHSSAR